MRKLRFWCQKVLPLVYDESLSYYELLCKVVDYINDLIEEANLTDEEVQNLQAQITEIKTYLASTDFTEKIEESVDKILTDAHIYELFEEFINNAASSSSTLHNMIAGCVPKSTPLVIDDCARIYDADHHIAFPALALISSTLHVYYRSGTAHRSFDGTIIHKTFDFSTRTFTDVDTYSLSGWDLRDPHPTANGAYIYCLARKADGTELKTVVITADGGTVSDVTFDGETGFGIGGAVFNNTQNNLNYFIAYTADLSGGDTPNRAYLAKQVSAGSVTNFTATLLATGYNEGSICNGNPSGATAKFIIGLRNQETNGPGLILESTSLSGTFAEYPLPFNIEGVEMLRTQSSVFLSYRCRNQDLNDDYYSTELVLRSMNNQYLGNYVYRYLRRVGSDCGYTNFADDGTYLYMAFYLNEQHSIFIAKIRRANLLQDIPTLVLNKTATIAPGLHTVDIPVHSNILTTSQFSPQCGSAVVVCGMRYIAQNPWQIGVNCYNASDASVEATVSARCSAVNAFMSGPTWVSMAGS